MRIYPAAVRRSLLACCLVALTACGGKSDTTPPPAAPTPEAGATAAQAGPVDPCTLLAAADLGPVFPGAGAGTRDTADDSYGIRTCIWKAGEEQLKVQVFDAAPGAAEVEARSLSLGLVDPKSANAATAVRLEPVKGAGDVAFAMAEKPDSARGVRLANAITLVQRGQRIVVITAPSLARKDRAEALENLGALARAAGQRL